MSNDIEWSHMQVSHGVQKRQSQQQLLDIIGEHCLTKVVNIPTCYEKTLDLLFANAHARIQEFSSGGGGGSTHWSM